jgi:hypothetical protein
VKFAYNKDALLVIGKSGSGKTKNVVMPIIAKIPKEKLFVLDPNYEYGYLPAGHYIRPLNYSPEYLDEFLVGFRRSHMDCLLVIEDLDLYEPRGSQELIRACINFRHQNIGLIMVSRRILGLPKVLVMKANYLAIFRGMSVEDMDYLYHIDSDWEGVQFPKNDYEWVLLENR